ncbi:MAG: hypothetical protein ABEH56_05000 [Salinirussus sp.]
MSRRTVPSPGSRGVGLDSGSARLVGRIRFLAFWLAVLLPAAHLPMLIAGYQGLPTFAGLLAANVLCLVVGQEYSP